MDFGYSAYHESHSKLAYDVWSLSGMFRLAALASAALTGFLLAGCMGGGLGPAAFSLPTADGVQTVSDAADALDGHRSLASENAKAAIAATDALGSFVRDVSADQRTIAHLNHRGVAAHGGLHLVRAYTVEQNGKRILSGSELVVRPASGAYCESSAGYTVDGIPSLDETFGWQSGAVAGGRRTTDNHGAAIWSARASGAVIQAQIGSLSIARVGTNAACPMSVPPFVVRGGAAQNAFSLPVSMAFRGGELSNLSVIDGRFASGESLEVATQTMRQGAQISGVIVNGRTQVATFRTNTAGAGTLTITSTGAQYVIADWIVVGT